MTRTFGRLLAEVVGVGLLLCVPVLADRMVDVASWLLTCSLGLVVGVATRLALAHRTEERGVLAGDPVEQGVISAWYVGGILAGQVFLCGFAGHVVAAAIGAGGAGGWIGVGLLVLSGLLALARPALGDAAKRARTVLTVLTALVWSWWPAAVDLSGTSSAVSAAGPVATGLLFFVSIVGWEVRRSWSPAESRTGRRVLFPVFLVVAAFGAGLISLRLVRAGADGPGSAGPVLAALVGLLAVSYCRTNLVAASTLSAGLRGTRGPLPVAAAVAPVAVVLVLAQLRGWEVGYFLYGPAAMTLCLFAWMSGRVAANAAAATGARVAGIAGAGALLVVSPALGPAILFPGVVGAIAFARFALVRPGGPAGAARRSGTEIEEAT
ncbi:hypothetical protein GCM10027271_45090 [Saccharopolyspora gloriosae]|uniref:Uncharacterized protein n=1 Tax=Saccharopolyspora gloriosae TaxID=455344 RepID=A0A840NGP7_9PSEU|nr:hypothetical protein [Saccharopolyspora gloriosae]MBB5070191.1 hypothetical protein [Saccharopolyspora gloriosae]